MKLLNWLFKMIYLYNLKHETFLSDAEFRKDKIPIYWNLQPDWLISQCFVLTHCGLVMPYGEINLSQHWLRQWLVAWWHHAITYPMLTYHQYGPVAFTGGQFLQKCPWYQSLNCIWKSSFQIMSDLQNPYKWMCRKIKIISCLKIKNFEKYWIILRQQDGARSVSPVKLYSWGNN